MNVMNSYNNVSEDLEKLSTKEIQTYLNLHKKWRMRTKKGNLFLNSTQNIYGKQQFQLDSSIDRKNQISNKTQIPVNLENFDSNKLVTKINSPRSLLVCEIEGIDINDLYYKSKIEVASRINF